MGQCQRSTEPILSYLKSTLGKNLEIREKIKKNTHIYVPQAVGDIMRVPEMGSPSTQQRYKKLRFWGPFSFSNVKGQLGPQAKVAIKAYIWQRLSS